MKKIFLNIFLDLNMLKYKKFGKNLIAIHEKKK